MGFDEFVCQILFGERGPFPPKIRLRKCYRKVVSTVPESNFVEFSVGSKFAMLSGFRMNMTNLTGFRA